MTEESSVSNSRFVAFLRGINVGGHHKVPMAELRQEMEKHGFTDVVTILNSGNILFNSSGDPEPQLAPTLAGLLEKRFGFAIPTIVRDMQEIATLYHADPFKAIELTQSIRRYVTFSPRPLEHRLSAPWTSADSSFQILELLPQTIVSVLDISVCKTPAAMKILEDHYGKDITTRNWNTIERIMKKL